MRFVTAPAVERDFELVTMFDCLHDMGDPRGCAKHVRGLLKPDGTWMIVEPIAAADDPAENVTNPVSHLYYNASTMICVPTSLAQEVAMRRLEPSSCPGRRNCASSRRRPVRRS